MAVIGASSTTRKIITDLGIEEMSAHLAEFHAALGQERDNHSLYSTEFRTARDACDDRKAKLLVQVSRDNEGKPESFIERQHKIALSEDADYVKHLTEVRSARENMDLAEGKVKVYEAEVRSIQVQMNLLAAALQAAAAQTRAKTTASIVGQQANLLLGANL